MRIAIDISQVVYEGTGVSAYVRKLVTALVSKDTTNEYILFGATLRRKQALEAFFTSVRTSAKAKKIRLVTIPLPPTLSDIVWNTLHILPIEWFVGPIDIFWSSDWTQPPALHAKRITTLHDLSILRFPEESHNATDVDYPKARISANIVAVQKRRLKHAVSECIMFFCDSEATKQDAKELLGISENKLIVVYPGYN